jgi:class 3 adenylate cyclase
VAVVQSPSGIVTLTLLFTDIEGSTRLWEERPEAMRAALARHDELLRAAIGECGGWVVKSTGDGVFAAFRVRSLGCVRRWAISFVVGWRG